MQPGTPSTSPSLDTSAGVRAAYTTHGAELYRFALRWLDDPGLAEEAVQDTFLRAWRSAPRYDPGAGSLRTWLFAIARNVVIDVHRARSVRPQPVELCPHHDVPDADIAEGLVVSWQVEDALRSLTLDHRQALVETYYRGRPYDDVAVELDIPVGTLRSRVFYALKALRLALQERGWDDDGH